MCVDDFIKSMLYPAVQNDEKLKDEKTMNFKGNVYVYNYKIGQVMIFYSF